MPIDYLDMDVAVLVLEVFLGSVPLGPSLLVGTLGWGLDGQNEEPSVRSDDPRLYE